MNFKDRVAKLLELTGYKSVSSLERTAGLSNGSLSKISNPTSKTIEKILAAFPNINRVWLETGEGPATKNIYIEKDDFDSILRTVEDSAFYTQLKMIENGDVFSRQQVLDMLKGYKKEIENLKKRIGDLEKWIDDKEKIIKDKEEIIEILKSPKNNVSPNLTKQTTKH